MPTPLPVVLFACAALALLLPQDPQKPSPPAAVPAKWSPDDLKKLAWLSGTWELKDGEVITEEHWRPLQGTTMLGTSHSFDAGSSRAFEFLRISVARGQLAYVAMPGGKTPTTFLVQKLADGLVEFENGEHDYPQRIRYERTKDGVTATISLLDGRKAQEFVFKKKA
jgi:hypothetical protein